MKLKHVFLCIMLLAAISTSSFVGVRSASAATHTNASSSGLTNRQKVVLYGIAYQTWRFFDADTDPNTHLPMDNLGLYGAPSGPYTSPTNIGVYFWSVVAAHDLGFIDYNGALQRANATLTEIEHLSKWNGFLFSWYDTTNGHRISGPGGTDQEGQPATGAFISTVDSGWYATGLILVRQEFPTLAQRATTLLNAMNFGIFYDNGDQSTNVNAGQMYGGYLADEGPANFHYGLLNTETRIAAYIGIGTHTMPGDVWWRTFRTLPASDGQGQTPQGYNVNYTDPQSGKQFTVFEGHYTYGGINFVPSWGGSMFEGLMNNLVIPETSWGPKGFGLNDLRYAQAQIAYTQQTLHYPIWGLSPSSTPDDTGGYQAYGAHALATNASCCPYAETAITPHASFLALDVDAQDAFTNIQTLLTRYKVFDRYGFFDAVDPITGQVGHRYLVLDQSMIMAALDNALQGNLMQQHFAQDPVIAAAQPYLAQEQFSIQ
ncbi:MAG TPA: glucoamylase family protein [Ktedonobacteraceae bacterium]|nr:glucoamylase family protein [Ktedonobacteraceae bacterium]